MASLLDHSAASFLSVKLAYRRSRHPLSLCRVPIARRGMRVVLGVYLALMVVHAVTGFSALGWHAPGTVLSYFASLPHAVAASLS